MYIHIYIYVYTYIYIYIYTYIYIYNHYFSCVCRQGLSLFPVDPQCVVAMGHMHIRFFSYTHIYGCAVDFGGQSVCRVSILETQFLPRSAGWRLCLPLECTGACAASTLIADTLCQSSTSFSICHTFPPWAETVDNVRTVPTGAARRPLHHVKCHARRVLTLCYTLKPILSTRLQTL